MDDGWSGVFIEVLMCGCAESGTDCSITLLCIIAIAIPCGPSSPAHDGSHRINPGGYILARETQGPYY